MFTFGIIQRVYFKNKFCLFTSILLFHLFISTFFWISAILSIHAFIEFVQVSGYILIFFHLFQLLDRGHVVAMSLSI